MSAGSRSAVAWIRANVAAEAAGQRPGERRLAAARRVLDQDVAAGEHGGDDHDHDVVVTAHHAADAGDECVRDRFRVARVHRVGAAVVPFGDAGW